MVRLGYTLEGDGIDPRETTWAEVGVAVFPTFGDDESANGSPRFIVQYLGELREHEDAHGMVGQLQIQW